MLADVVTKTPTRVSLLVLVAMLTTHVALAQTIPLQAADAQVTDDGDLQYDLTNVASEPATAWCVFVTVRDPNGTLIRESAIITDEYRVEALEDSASKDERDGYLLRVKRRRHFVVTGPFDPRFQLSVTPAAIVFADRTSAGHPRIIDSIFQRRAGDRDALLNTLHQLRSIDAHAPGIDALQDAIAKLARSRHPADTGGPSQEVEQRLRQALTHTGEPGFDPARALTDEIECVRREYQAAARHAVPRKE
jgi:hypothetical protein